MAIERDFDSGVPHLETSRLILRGHRAHDLDACAAMWAEPEVVRYITGKPSTRAETWARMARYRGFWSLLGYGYWALQEKSSARFIGEVGFFDVLREIEPSIAGTPEVGWILTPAFHAKGFAREALGAVLAWADATLPAERTAALVVQQNVRSVRLAERAGYAVAQTVMFGSEPTLLCYRDRPRLP